MSVYWIGILVLYSSITVGAQRELCEWEENQGAPRVCQDITVTSNEGYLLTSDEQLDDTCICKFLPQNDVDKKILVWFQPGVVVRSLEDCNLRLGVFRTRAGKGGAICPYTYNAIKYSFNKGNPLVMKFMTNTSREFTRYCVKYRLLDASPGELKIVCNNGSVETTTPLAIPTTTTIPITTTMATTSEPSTTATTMDVTTLAATTAISTSTASTINATAKNLSTEGFTTSEITATMTTATTIISSTVTEKETATMTTATTITSSAVTEKETTHPTTASTSLLPIAITSNAISEPVTVESIGNLVTKAIPQYNFAKTTVKPTSRRKHNDSVAAVVVQDEETITESKAFIIGVAIGGAALMIILVVLIAILWRCQKRRRASCMITKYEPTMYRATYPEDGGITIQPLMSRPIDNDTIPTTNGTTNGTVNNGTAHHTATKKIPKRSTSDIPHDKSNSHNKQIQRYTSLKSSPVTNHNGFNYDCPLILPTRMNGPGDNRITYLELDVAQVAPGAIKVKLRGAAPASDHSSVTYRL